jgi:hypothetical protein
VTTLEFRGEVETWADPDNKQDGLTIRIGGRDVIEEISCAFPGPHQATVTINGRTREGVLRVFVGEDACGDGCCGASAYLQVDGHDLFEILDEFDTGHQVRQIKLGSMFAGPAPKITMTITGEPVSAPPPPPEVLCEEVLCEVTLAHHYEGNAPLDIIVVPKRIAGGLQRSGWLLAGTEIRSVQSQGGPVALVEPVQQIQ